MMPLMCLHRLATRGLVPWNFSYQPSTCTSAPWFSGNFATYSCTCNCRSIASGVPCGAGGCRPTEISTGLGGMDDPKAYRLIVSSRNVALMSSDLLEWHSAFDHVWSLVSGKRFRSHHGSWQGEMTPFLARQCYSVPNQVVETADLDLLLVPHWILLVAISIIMLLIPSIHHYNLFHVCFQSSYKLCFMILIREALQQWHPLQDAAEILSAFHSLWSLSLGEQPTRYLHLATWCVFYSWPSGGSKRKTDWYYALLF